MRYGKPPKDLGFWDGRCEEMLFYQYLPVKLAGVHEMNRFALEPRLWWTEELLGRCVCDFVALRGLSEFVRSYVYLTAKHLWVAPGCNLNRSGWHCDGFGTDDINYAWSNCVPTIFNDGPFDLPACDVASMMAMDRQADWSKNYTFPNCHVLRMDQYVVHQTADPDLPQLRTFVKVSISRDRYDLLGNAVNPMLDYQWEMRPREEGRNIPQVLGKSVPTTP